MDPEKPTQHPLSRAISWFYSSLLIIDSGFPFNFRIFPVFVLSNNFCLFFPVDFFALLSITCSLLAEKRHGYRLAFYTQECKVTKTFRKIQSLQCNETQYAAKTWLLNKGTDRVSINIKSNPPISPHNYSHEAKKWFGFLKKVSK
jgi:hypothetical protein